MNNGTERSWNLASMKAQSTNRVYFSTRHITNIHLAYPFNYKPNHADGTDKSSALHSELRRADHRSRTRERGGAHAGALQGGPGGRHPTARARGAARTRAGLTNLSDPTGYKLLAPRVQLPKPCPSTDEDSQRYVPQEGDWVTSI